MSDRNPLGEERKDIRYIRDVLWPEFLRQFIEDNAEYPEERPLGARAEWHGMHRKVGKLKAPVWDGKEWTGRESVRRMFQEIVGHAFLAIASLDYDGANCSQECGEAHTYGVGCSVGRMLRKPTMSGSDLCGAIAVGGRCRLPRGHNKGFLDIPEQHDAHPQTPAEPWPGTKLREQMTARSVSLGPGSVVPAPADETEAYTEQRRVRAGRAESRSEATDREAAAWRVRHCGPGCAYAHRYSGECMNQE